MIEYLSGILVSKTTTQSIIDVNGIGYKVNCSINTFDNLPGLNNQVKLLIHFHIYDNGQELFGFYDEIERDLFNMLIGVSGIGPKTAMNMLSAVRPDEFKNRLIAGEVKMLTALPGIGPKTARRIIVELKDKFGKFDDEILPLEDDWIDDDAFYALKSLGFSAKQIRKTINQITKEDNSLNTEQIVKKSLLLLK